MGLLELASMYNMVTKPARCKRIEDIFHVHTDAEILPILPQLLTALRSTESLSLAGAQPKVCIGDYYVKYDTDGQKQGMKEWLCCKFFDHVLINSTLVPHVEYWRIPGGCFSEEYKAIDESETLLSEYLSASYIEALDSFVLADDVARIFICDALVYNEDRHFGNLPVLTSPRGMRLAPLFDLGNALSGDNYEHYEPNPYLHEQVAWAFSRLNADVVIDYTAFKKEVHCVPERLDTLMQYWREHDVRIQ